MYVRYTADDSFAFCIQMPVASPTKVYWSFLLLDELPPPRNKKPHLPPSNQYFDVSFDVLISQCQCACRNDFWKVHQFLDNCTLKAAMSSTKKPTDLYNIAMRYRPTAITSDINVFHWGVGVYKQWAILTAINRKPILILSLTLLLYYYYFFDAMFVCCLVFYFFYIWPSQRSNRKISWRRERSFVEQRVECRPKRDDADFRDSTVCIACIIRK